MTVSWVSESKLVCNTFKVIKTNIHVIMYVCSLECSTHFVLFFFSQVKMKVMCSTEWWRYVHFVCN
jgi:hypothetical protein